MARRNVRGTRWTPEEEEILIEEIGKNPTCMRASFLAASAHLHRSPSAVSAHWYTYMAKREDVCAKVTVGRTTAVPNKVRLKPGQEPIPIRRSIFENIVAYLRRRR